MNEKLKAIISKAYDVFSRYSPPNLSNVGFFDFPTQEQLQEITKPLREISDEVVRSMEFFMGATKQEVKYLLPRLLEFTAADPDENLFNPGIFSLFADQLSNSLKAERSYLDANEKGVLRDFFIALIQETSGNGGRQSFVIEAAVAVGVNAEDISCAWSPPKDTADAQLRGLFEEFGLPCTRELNKDAISQWIANPSVTPMYLEQWRAPDLAFALSKLAEKIVRG